MKPSQFALIVTLGACAGALAQPPTALPLLPERPKVVTPRGQAPADLARLSAGVSPERLRADLDALCAFGTRHTLSEAESATRGIGAARTWLKARFEEALAGTPGALVSLDTHRVKPDGRRIDVDAEVVNVVAMIPGRSKDAKERLVYVTAHYDTINGDVMDRVSEAPGANDDGSGTVVLLELARALADATLDATVVLMATAGEEQGLIGARLHAAQARQEGRNIVAVLNLDIVGDPAGPHPRQSAEAEAGRRTIRVFSEGAPKAAPAVELAQIAMLGAENDSPARQLARLVAEVGAWTGSAVQPMLVHRNDRFLRGGDHSAFLEAGYPAAVRFTAPFEDYGRQHQNVREETVVDGAGRQRTVLSGDLPEFVEEKYLADVARLVLASAVTVANAPAAPADARVITAQLETGTTIRWSEAPDTDRAGYEVLVRATSSPMWEHVIDVGPALEWATPISKDNWLFAVRSYDRDGHRSQAVFTRAARE